MGFMGTTGSPFTDYVLTDRLSAAAEFAGRHFSEKLMYVAEPLSMFSAGVYADGIRLLSDGEGRPSPSSSSSLFPTHPDLHLLPHTYLIYTQIKL